MCVLISWTLGGATCVPGTVFGTYALSLCMNTIAKLMIEVRVRVIVGVCYLRNTAVPAKKLTNSYNMQSRYVRVDYNSCFCLFKVQVSHHTLTKHNRKSGVIKH